MGRNLTNLYISQSFQFLTQVSGSELQDGLGNTITGSLLITASLANTANTASYVLNAVSSSFATTASYALNAGTTLSTASLLTTASATNNVITFTKGDSSTFNVTVATGSAVTVNTGSLLVTASISNATTTFTKGDGSTFSITANNVVNANSASVATTAATASYTPNAVTTASVSSNTITFTKGDASTFNITVDTGSVVNTGSLLVTASISNATTTFTKGDGSTFSLVTNNVVNADSASLAATATTASFAQTIANGLSPTFANATASNVLITGTASVALLYTQTVSSSVIFTSGSNQLGDNPTLDTQSLYGRVIVTGSLEVSGSADFQQGLTGSLLGTASYATTAATASNTPNAVVTASVSSNTITFTKGDGSTFPVTVNTGSVPSPFPYTGSAQITGSFAVTGSVEGNVIGNNTDTYTSSAAIQQIVTLTQAEYNAISASANPNTFYVISDSTAFNSSTFATTGSNTFVGNQIVTGSLTVTGNIIGSIVSASYAATASFANSGFQVGQLTIKTPGAVNNDNTIIGREAGNNISTEKNSTLVGSQAGYNIATGTDNVAVGYQAMYGQLTIDSTGNSNVAVGTNAGLQIRAGSSNVAIGNSAMYTGGDFPAGNVTASFNTVVGNSAAKKLYYGNNNTVIGSLTGQLLSIGSNNTIVGANYSGSDFDNTVVLTDGQGNVQFYATGGLATFTNITASSINVTNGFTGSLAGTASFASNFTIPNLQSVTTAGATTSASVTINNTASADYWMVDTKPFAKLDTSTIVAGRIDGADEDFVLAGRNYAGGTSGAITMTDGEFIYNQTNHIFTGSVSLNSTLNVTGVTTLKDDVTITGSLRGNVGALSISSQTASLDCSTGNFFTLLLVSGSNTFVNPSNILPGQTINLRVKQASVASGSISFASSIKQVSGSAYTPTTTANGEDVVTFISFDSTNLYLSNIKNFI